VLYDKIYEIYYVGDYNSLQLFTLAGECIQRFDPAGETPNKFHDVVSICIIKDQLYVGVGFKERIQIFKRKS